MEVLVLFALARVFGALAARLGQPASVGELLTGILLALLAAWYATEFPFLEQLVSSTTLQNLANLGIFCLLLQAGLEMKPSVISRRSKGALTVALGGVLVPLVSGCALAWFFLPESPNKQALVLAVGVAVSITAIPATIKVLTDLRQLKTPIGQMVVTAALFDDVFGFILLAVLLGIVEGGDSLNAINLVLLTGKIIAFFIITTLLGTKVYPRMRHHLGLVEILPLEFSALVIVALSYGLLAELLGLHWILGAFMAGLYFESARVGQRAYKEMKLLFTAITGGFLGPLFFATIGLKVELGVVTAIPTFLCLLIAVAVLGKVIGAGLPALGAGFKPKEAAAVGIGMSARGAVELVILGVVYEAGLFATGATGDKITDNLFSALILMAVVTTLLVPMGLKLVLKERS